MEGKVLPGDINGTVNDSSLPQNTPAALTFLLPRGIYVWRADQQTNGKIAMGSGGLFGQGYLQGDMTQRGMVPENQNDMVLTVAGEEFGVWLCLLLIILFAVIVIRALRLSLKDNNLFVIYAAAGLAASFGLQGIINMASTLHLMPTKGMTLPFISYGVTFSNDIRASLSSFISFINL